VFSALYLFDRDLANTKSRLEQRMMGMQATTLQWLIARASLVTLLFVQLRASAFPAGSEDDFFEAKIRPTAM